MIKENWRFKDWYQDSRRAIIQRYNTHADLFIDLLAATSPRKQVISNFKLAHRILIEVLDTGTFNREGMMKIHADNVQRAINGEPLSGNKVRRFAENLHGNLTPVTIDIWMLRYLYEGTRQKGTQQEIISIASRARSSKPDTGQSRTVIA